MSETEPRRENFSLRKLTDPQVLTITGFPPYDGQWVRHTPSIPTKPSVIRAVVNGRSRLLYGPLRNGNSFDDWCEASSGYAVLAQDIESFEILWTEDA